MTAVGPGGDNSIDRAADVKRAVAAQLRTYPNVAGIGVGLKEVGGKRTELVAIRVYVERKLPLEQLADSEVLPREVEGIPVDVIEARFQVHQLDQPEDHQRRHNPMLGGISIVNEVLGGSGTLGASVFDNRTRQDLLLSNWHVLCGSLTCSPGEPIIQPGTGGGDTGTSADFVGRLERAVLTDEVDGAVAVLSGHRFLRRDLLNLGSFAGLAVPILGEVVRKSGRTTGVTAGVVADVSADVDVRGYPQGTLAFRNQLVIENDNPSEPGDSGSIWIDGSNRVIGLNFAGSPGRAVANPIAAVIAGLDIDLDRGVTMQHFIAATNSVLN